MIKKFRLVSSGRPAAVLAAVCLAALALPLSFSGGALATPAIGRDLAGGPVAMNWITSAFMLAFGSLLMAAGTLADRFGRKRVFAAGVGGFTLCSLLLGFAPSLWLLDVLRGVQGIAAAAALAGGTAALAQEFDGVGRTRAFSLLGTTFGLGLAFGPVLAGVLIDSWGWRAVFAASAVAGLLSLVFGVPHMRESRDPAAQAIDWPGIATFTGALTCLTFATIQSTESGWAAPLVQAALAGAAVLAVAFHRVETRVARPMLDLTLFRYSRFVGVQLLPVATCFSYIVLLVVLPSRLVGIEHFSELEAGILMVALSAPMLVVPVLAALLTRWVSAGTLSGAGLVIAAVGLYWLSVSLANPAGAAPIGPLLTIGVGAGLPWGLMDGLSVSVVPTERAGMAAGIFSTARVAGECIALALVNAVLAALTYGRIAATVHTPVPPDTVRHGAARLANGELGQAAALLPHVAPAALLDIYTGAFDVLLRGLCVITLLCALAAMVFLRRPRSAAPSPVHPAR